MVKRIYRLAHYSIFRLYFMAMGVWFVEQVISYMIENIIWGRWFYHWFDVLFLLGLFGVFVWLASDMSDRITITLTTSGSSTPESEVE